jgi:hypothetical protein
MSERRPSWSRRAFVGGFTLAGAAGLVGVRPRPVSAEPPLEMTKIRLLRSSSVCWARSTWRRSSCEPRGSRRYSTALPLTPR